MYVGLYYQYHALIYPGSQWWIEAWKQWCMVHHRWTRLSNFYQNIHHLGYLRDMQYLYITNAISWNNYWWCLLSYDAMNIWLLMIDLFPSIISLAYYRPGLLSPQPAMHSHQQLHWIPIKPNTSGQYNIRLTIQNQSISTHYKDIRKLSCIVYLSLFNTLFYCWSTWIFRPSMPLTANMTTQSNKNMS